MADRFIASDMYLNISPVRACVQRALCAAPNLLALIGLALVAATLGYASMQTEAPEVLLAAAGLLIVLAALAIAHFPLEPFQ